LALMMELLGKMPRKLATQGAFGVLWWWRREKGFTLANVVRSGKFAREVFDKKGLTCFVP